MPKSSSAMRTPSVAQLVQRWRASPRCPASSTDSVISSSSRLRRQAGGGKRGDDRLRRRCRLLNWTAERLTATLMCSGQLGGLGAGLPQHPLAERHDQPGLLGERNELGRRDHAALGMVPAQQRLEAADLVALEVDERLVVELELAVGERLAQVELAACGAPACRASISGSKKR